MRKGQAGRGKVRPAAQPQVGLSPRNARTKDCQGGNQGTNRCRCGSGGEGQDDAQTPAPPPARRQGPDQDLRSAIEGFRSAYVVLGQRNSSLL
jgi:hypothetical protein